MIITIKNIEEKTKDDNKWITLTDENDRTHNIFSNLQDKWALCFEGATVELTKKKNGQYWDVVDIKPSGVKEAVEQDKSAQFASKANERSSIQAQTAVKAVVEMLCNKVTVPLYIVDSMYDKLAEWLDSVPQKEHKEPSVPPEATELATEAQKKKIAVLVREKEIPTKSMHDFIFKEYNKTSSKELTVREASGLIKALEEGKISVSK